MQTGKPFSLTLQEEVNLKDQISLILLPELDQVYLMMREKKRIMKTMKAMLLKIKL